MKCICSLRSPEGCGRKGPVWPIHGCNKVLINYDAQCSRVAAPLTSGAPCAETRVEPSSTARQVSAKPSMKRTSDRAKEKLHKHIRKALQETGARREIRRSGCFASGELRTRQSAKVRLQKTTLNLRSLRPRRQCEKATKRKTYASSTARQVSAKPSMKRTSDRAKEKLHKHIRKALQETGARREIRRSGCFASGELRTRQSAKVRLQKTTLNLRGLRPRRQCEKATKRKTYALQNSPQRLSCIRRAVLATGAAGHRLEHDIKSARPAAAATARNCQKKQKP